MQEKVFDVNFNIYKKNNKNKNIANKIKVKYKNKKNKNKRKKNKVKSNNKNKKNHYKDSKDNNKINIKDIQKYQMVKKNVLDIQPDYKFEKFYYWNEQDDDYHAEPELIMEYDKLKKNNPLLSIEEFCNGLGIEEI